MRRLVCMALSVLLLCASALAEDFAQTYEGFTRSYVDNITLLNQSTGRMLLPHSPQRDYDQQSRRFYRIDVGYLTAEIHMDDAGKVIRLMRITLTAPDGMRQGDALYDDFTVSAYHSYALLMSMDLSPTAYERYDLVQQVEAGLAQSDEYRTNAGDYRLTCTRAGNSVTFVFENELLMPAGSDCPDEDMQEEDNILIG